MPNNNTYNHLVIGDFNLIKAFNNSIFINGDFNGVGGSSSYSNIFGSSNSTLATYSTIFGYGNHIGVTGYGSFLVGNNYNIYNPYTLVLSSDGGTIQLINGTTSLVVNPTNITINGNIFSGLTPSLGDVLNAGNITEYNNGPENIIFATNSRIIDFLSTNQFSIDGNNAFITTGIGTGILFNDGGGTDQLTLEGILGNVLNIQSTNINPVPGQVNIISSDSTTGESFIRLLGGQSPTIIMGSDPGTGTFSELTFQFGSLVGEVSDGVDTSQILMHTNNIKLVNGNALLDLTNLIIDLSVNDGGSNVGDISVDPTIVQLDTTDGTNTTTLNVNSSLFEVDVTDGLLTTTIASLVNGIDLFIPSQISNGFSTGIVMQGSSQNYLIWDFINISTTGNTTTTHQVDFVSYKVFSIEVNVTGYDPTATLGYSATLFAVFQKVAGVVTQIGTTTKNEKSNFTTSTTDVNTNATIIRVSATGEVGLNITWHFSYKIHIQN